MKLYHGTPAVFDEPKIIVDPQKTYDFGTGFYMTTTVKQSKIWALNRLKDEAPEAYVNVYDVDNENLSELKRCVFTFSDEDIEKWIDFVMANRNVAGFQHDHDIVIGPVADDNVYESISLYEQGIITRRALKEKLLEMNDVLPVQWLFHTEKALSVLKFKKRITIKPDNKSKNKTI